MPCTEVEKSVWCGPVWQRGGACAAYLSNDDGHTPRAHHSSVAYEPVTMIKMPVLGAILTRNRGRGVAVEQLGK